MVNPTSSKVIFDVADMSFNIPGAAYVFCVLILLYPLFFRKKKKLRSLMRSKVAFIGITSVYHLLIIFNLAISMHTVREYQFVKKLRENNEYNVVEGVVEKFVPARGYWKGGTMEGFSVGHLKFRYNISSTEQTYHSASFGKGPIKNGAEVRIFYYGRNPKILRLEIMDQ